MDLNNIEKMVLNKLFEGDHPALATLREQAVGAWVRARELTGSGFFTEFSLRPDAKPLLLPFERIKIDDVMATAKELKGGIGFILDINNGFIETLEGYTYEEPWPGNTVALHLYYENPTRDKLFERFG